MILDDWSPPRLLISSALTAAVLMTAWLAADVAWSADDSPTASLVESVKQARKAKDEAAIRQALERLPDLHNASDDKKERATLQSVAGSVLKDKKLGDVRAVAARALGTLNDTKGAFKQLKPFLPGPATDASDPLASAVLDALKTLRVDDSIDSLLKLVAKGKAINLREQGIGVLGTFGESKKRESIAAGLIGVLVSSKKKFQKAEKSKSKDVAKKLDAQTPWSRLSEPIAAALSLLTGRTDVSSPDAWIAAFEQARKKPGALFVSTKAK